MATRKKSTATPKKKAAPKTSKSKELINWDEELAKFAEKAAATEKNVGGGNKFFSTQSGILSFDDSPIPGNEMVVIILDHVLENVYYEEAFDPDEPAPPTCFAFGYDEDEIGPHESVVEAGQNQSKDGCASCEHNQWESADKGRGKACRNIRRLALIRAGSIDKKSGEVELFEEPESFSTDIAFLKIPPTSITGYSGYVNQLKNGFGRPPFAVYTRIYIEPDPKTQFKIKFEALEKVDFSLLDAIKKKVDEAESIIQSPYSLEIREDPKPKSKAKAKSRKRKY